MASVSISCKTHPNDARAVLERYLDALTEGRLDAIADSFTEHATWCLHGDLPLSGIWWGREDIMSFLVGAGSLYEPGTQQFDFGTLIAEGDTAVLEWRVRGIASATGLPYDNEYCGVFEIVDGRISAVREYLDSLHASEMLFTPERAGRDHCTQLR